MSRDTAESSSDSDSEVESVADKTSRACKMAYLKRLNVVHCEKEAETAPADFFFIDTAANEEKNDKSSSNAPIIRKKKSRRSRHKPSMKLINLEVKNKEDVDKMLAKAVLQPDYDCRAVAEVAATSWTQQKKQRKLEREKTAGKGWYNMAATELTDERRRDLELLRMRGAIDPRAHYRKMDRDAFPKYFEVGRLVENKADYYSSRLTKRERKRTMIEELMEDVETVAKAKQKYTQIQLHKTAAKRRGVSFSTSAMSKRTKYKNKARSH